MSLFEERKKRKIQAKANAFVKTLSGKEEKTIEKEYLDNKELENNEIVLTYLFFNYPNLIRILPLDFQVSRINSNLSMFNYGSDEAKQQIVLNWLNENKFFMNSFVVKFSDEEYNKYLTLYFKRPDDITKLYMEDLEKVITILDKNDFKETKNVINTIKDKLTLKQWEYIIPVNPAYIEFAPSHIQDKYCDDDKYARYISGSAKEKYITNQFDKINNDITILDTMDLEIQKEYILKYPSMINYIDEKILVNILKYDISLIKYVNISSLRNGEDKSHKFIYKILENINNKSISEVIDIFIDKGLLNAKGKLYRFDSKSNNLSYQYSKKIINIIQSLSLDTIKSLIDIDINYILPFVCPLYNDSVDNDTKSKIIIDCNSRCLNLFKMYYNNDEIYSKYYRVINKIFDEYYINLDKYNYFIDYNCIFDLFKILFNKKIIFNNEEKKIITYIGLNLKYKNYNDDNYRSLKIKLLNELLSNAYQTKIDNNCELYELSSLELFDNRLSFINKDLLYRFNKCNYTNISSLLYIIKRENDRNLFINYYNILKLIYNDSRETLYKSIENFTYNKSLMKSLNNVNLNSKELVNYIDIILSYNNPLNINDYSSLSTYDLDYLKQFLIELSNTKNTDIYKNILCRYLFNRGYNTKGNSGWLDVMTISQICNIFDYSILSDFKVDNKSVFNDNEINFLKFIEKLFSSNDDEILFSFVEQVLNKKVNRNIVVINSLFEKLKKYRKDFINDSIVTSEELISMSETYDFITVKKVDGVSIYNVSNNDFKVLSSYNDDKIHYYYGDASGIDKTSYCYDLLPSDCNMRFINYEDKTLIKLDKDNIKPINISPKYILVVGNVNDEVLNVAKKNNLSIVVLEEKTW